MDMDTISSGEPTLLVISGADHFSRTTDGTGGFVSSFLRSFFNRITNRDKVTNQDKVERRNIKERIRDECLERIRNQPPFELAEDKRRELGRIYRRAEETLAE